MKKRILITGGAGFIGGHLCDALLNMGNKVIILDNFSTGYKNNVPSGVKIIEGDITSKKDCSNACKNIDIIIHLAASVTIRKSSDVFQSDANVNIIGTINLLEASEKYKVQRFIFASSMGVYSDSFNKLKNNEDFDTNPISPYGISKLTGEKYVLLLGQRLGIEPVVLRLFNTYGTRQGYTPYVGVVTIFITNILNGQSCTIYGNGKQCRDFIHVSDVVNAFCLSTSSKKAKGQIFNIGTGVGLSVNKIYEIVSQELGGGNFSYIPSNGTELQFSVADNYKAKKLLGFTPKYSFEEKVNEVIEYIKNNNLS